MPDPCGMILGLGCRASRKVERRLVRLTAVFVADHGINTRGAIEACWSLEGFNETMCPLHVQIC